MKPMLIALALISSFATAECEKATVEIDQLSKLRLVLGDLLERPRLKALNDIEAVGKETNCVRVEDMAVQVAQVALSSWNSNIVAKGITVINMIAAKSKSSEVQSTALKILAPATDYIAIDLSEKATRAVADIAIHAADRQVAREAEVLLLKITNFKIGIQSDAQGVIKSISVTKPKK